MHLALLKWGLGLLLSTPLSGFATEPSPFKTGVLFRRELNRPVNIFRTQISVRAITEQLSALHGIPILLDRRIDPDRIVDVELTQLSLRESLDALADQWSAAAAVIGGTVIIGPPEGLDRTRTDIERQRLVLRSPGDQDFQHRTFPLLLAQTFRWNDLQTPRALIGTIAARFGLHVENEELIPHDLWAGGALVDVDAIEALTIVVGQYDLTINWGPDAQTVTLASVPERLTIEQVYRIGDEHLPAACALIAREVPRAILQQDTRQVRVLATVGEHERIASLLTPAAGTAEESAPDPGPLRHRTFTLTTRRAPAIAILRKLETQDVVVEYDAEVLRAAGIDLSQKVTLSLRKASAEELFQAICEPLGLTFEIEDKTVRLSPKP